MGIIGSIRKHSWVAVVIVGLAIVLFILGDLTKNSRGADTTVGKVDGNTLSHERFEVLLNEMRNNYMQQSGTASVPSEVEQQMRNAVWENYVDETLLNNQMERLGLTVTDEEEDDMYTGTFIDPNLRQLFTNPETGQYDARAAAQYHDSPDQMPPQQRAWWINLQKQLKDNRQRQKYYSMLSAGMYMPKAIAKQVDKYGATRADVRLAMQSYQSMPDEEAPVEEADYQKYYSQHRAEFRVDEEHREVEYIAFPITPSQQDLAAIQADVMKNWDSMQVVADTDMAFFVNTMSIRSYDTLYHTSASFAAPMSEMIAASHAGELIAPQLVSSVGEWQMAKVMDVAMRPDSMRATIAVVLGGTFENAPRSNEVAQMRADSALAAYTHGMAAEQVVDNFSDEKRFFGQGNDSEWQLDGWFDLNMGGAYLRLNSRMLNTPVNGGFVAPLPNKLGYAVVMVTGKTAPVKKFRVAVIAKAINPSTTTIRARQTEAEMLAGNNRDEASLVEAARQQNLPVRNAVLTAGQDNLANGFKGTREVVRWAFDEKTKVGDVSEKVFRSSEQDAFIVVAVKDAVKPEYATLDQVRSDIEHLVRIDKKAEKMMARMDEAAKQSKDINAVAAKLGTTVDTLDGIGFADYYLGRYGMEPKVLATASTAKGLVGPIKGANGVYMMQVDGQTTVEAATPDATQRRMEQTYNQKLGALGAMLRERAKIKEQRVKFF